MATTNDSRTPPTNAVTVRALLEKKIEALDLSGICTKLMTSGWSIDMVIHTDREYRQFLLMRGLHPDMPVMSTPLIDQFWHQHILDTAKYQADSDAIFGRVLPGIPKLGSEGFTDDEIRH